MIAKSTHNNMREMKPTILTFLLCIFTPMFIMFFTVIGNVFHPATAITIDDIQEGATGDSFKEANMNSKGHRKLKAKRNASMLDALWHNTFHVIEKLALKMLTSFVEFRIRCRLMWSELWSELDVIASDGYGLKIVKICAGAAYLFLTSTLTRISFVWSYPAKLVKPQSCNIIDRLMMFYINLKKLSNEFKNKSVGRCIITLLKTRIRMNASAKIPSINQLLKQLIPYRFKDATNSGSFWFCHFGYKTSCGKDRGTTCADGDVPVVCEAENRVHVPVWIEHSTPACDEAECTKSETQTKVAKAEHEEMRELVAPQEKECLSESIKPVGLDSERLEKAEKIIGLDDFNFIAVLGQGGYGKVMLAEEKITKQTMRLNC
jgi:hypothetical protein